MMYITNNSSIRDSINIFLDSTKSRKRENEREHYLVEGIFDDLV